MNHSGSGTLLNRPGGGLRLRLIVAGFLVILGLALTACGAGPQRIVYLDPDGNVATVSPDGRDDEAITDDADCENDDPDERICYNRPQWSPDHRWIAAFRAEGDDTALWLARPDGSGTQEVPLPADTVDISFADAFSWSPDSRRIAWIGEEDGVPGIYVLVVGEDDFELAVEGEGSEEGDMRPIRAGWTPAGRLAYTLYDGTGEATINTSRPDGSDERELEVDSGEDIVAYAVFSPQGNRMAYIGYVEEDNETFLYVARSDGSDAGQINKRDEDTFITPIEWSPDGSRLLVSGNTLMVYDVREDDLDEIAALEDEDASVYNCSFASDSKRLLCQLDDEIVLIDLDEQDVDSVIEGSSPDW